MHPDRLQIPELLTPATIPVIRAETIELDNGLRVYVINAGTEDVVKLDLVFPSGAGGKHNFSIASAAHHLIDTGTSSKKAIDIAESFDFYGSYLQTDFGPDWKSISLYALSRFFNESLKDLMEILYDASYPEEEVENWKVRTIQSLKINREKVSWLSKVAFNESLFGADHPYGITSMESDYEKTDALSIRKFYKENYNIAKATIIISGKAGSNVIKVLNDTFGKIKISNSVDALELQNIIPENLHSKKIIEKKDAVQSGIRIGKKLFSKNHPDYQPLQIANTILGGYFGSRLMSNIREDKGYTYGIGSGIHPHLNSGFFYIATEVGTDIRDAAIKEIYFEINRLVSEPVPEAELALVKNYLIGSFQRSLDGPFALADRFRGIHLFGLGYDFLDNYVKLLHSITPERVMEVASRHLQPGTMNEIIAG